MTMAAAVFSGRSTAVAAGEGLPLLATDVDRLSGLTTEEDNEDDAQTVRSVQSQLSSGSLWMPLPPELDETQLNAIDIQTLGRELQSYSDRQRSKLWSSSSSVSSQHRQQLQLLEQWQQLQGLQGQGLGQQGQQSNMSRPSVLAEAAAAFASSSSSSSSLPSQLQSAANAKLSNGLAILSKPFQLTVDGMIIMHLDEEHRIHRLEFMSSSLCANQYGFHEGNSPTTSSLSSSSPSLLTAAKAAASATLSSTGAGVESRKRSLAKL
jgi:hypothetical protein